MKWNISKIASLLLIAAMPLSAMADFPDRPLKLIVFLPPGSGPDNLARTLGNFMAKRLGQPVIVDNRPGASGSIALTAVAKSPADGYTLGVVASGPMAINVGLIKDLRYSPTKDFTPISQVAVTSNVVVANNDLRVKTPNELVALGKKKDLKYSSGGSGTVTHLAAAEFAYLGKFPGRHIPYKGTAQGVLPIISGEVDFGVYPLPNVASLINDGRLTAIAVASNKRAAHIPNVPTAQEIGFPNYVVDTTYGVIGPANMPKVVVDKLHEVISAALNDAGVKETLTSQGFDAVVSPTPADYGRKIESEIAYWTGVVKRVDATVD